MSLLATLLHSLAAPQRGIVYGWLGMGLEASGNRAAAIAAYRIASDATVYGARLRALEQQDRVELDETRRGAVAAAVLRVRTMVHQLRLADLRNLYLHAQDSVLLAAAQQVLAEPLSQENLVGPPRQVCSPECLGRDSQQS